jgi:plastocyanin
MLVVMGCDSHRQFPDSSLTGGVSEVKIGESVMAPMVVTAKRGDEVRWINASNGPVEVSVVQTREELISCQKGFASTDLGYLMGTSEYENIVMATVPQNEFASLCFAQPGKYAYSVRKGSLHDRERLDREEQWICHRRVASSHLESGASARRPLGSTHVLLALRPLYSEAS